MSGGAVFFVFFGGGPVDQRRGEFLPFIAFGAQVAHAVAFDLIFRDQLVGAIFEDEAAGEILGGGKRGEREQEDQSGQGGNAATAERSALTFIAI